mgnify:CR=1 FL=1
MSNPASIVEELLQVVPHLRPQLYFKTSLTALSHAMEDQVLAGADRPLVIASFQQERFYRQEANRYLRIAELTDQVYVLSAEGTSFINCSDTYETIAFNQNDTLTEEWHLVVIGQAYSACLICRERSPAPKAESTSRIVALEQTRRFEGIWTQDRYVTLCAAEILLKRIEAYRPELVDKTAAARSCFLQELSWLTPDIDQATSDPFTQRLVTYLQAGQYKLLKAYKAISAQERQERLVNSITSAIRQSLDPSEIFEIAVRELGQALDVCRCLIYRWTDQVETVKIEHQHLKPGVDSLAETHWSLSNPLFEYVRESQEMVAIEDTSDPESPFKQELDDVRSIIKQWNIRSWLIAPLIYQKRLLGIIELHHCQSDPYLWKDADKVLIDAIATQLSVAIIQAEAYANLQTLNQQLAALERTRSNLIAITGHELRTPLSTIQVCLESLFTEPDMPKELQQTMLQSALEDAERMRKLVQDFLTLSRLESGRIEWNLESLSLEECIDLSLSNIHAQQGHDSCPEIIVELPARLPLVRTDGEWLVEVLVKLLNNACKFTQSDETITVSAKLRDDGMVEVIVSDTGRGIEPDRLEVVFDRFYQEEGALRRSTGGTGLGLAMCRQIVEGLGGTIWANSEGKDQGSEFHFTLPVAQGQVTKKASKSRTKPSAMNSPRHLYQNQDSLLIDEIIG